MWQRLASRGEPTFREVFAIVGVGRPLALPVGRVWSPVLLDSPGRRGGPLWLCRRWVQAHSVRMGLLPCAGRGPGRRGGAVAGGWLVVQAHSVRMGLLPCAGRGPGRRGGAVAGGWLVVQAHSVRMGLLPCPCADSGQLVVQAHSVRMALLPCAARGPGRRGGAVAGGWLVVRPTRYACASPCCSAAR